MSNGHAHVTAVCCDKPRTPRRHICSDAALKAEVGEPAPAIIPINVNKQEGGWRAVTRPAF